MTGSPRLIQTTTATLLAAALSAAPAFGQTQVQGGSAHDANQQVGGGGYNKPGEQIDYQARNLLITGQVGGGRSFQGDVGYSAPGTFQGNLPSDSLFRFQRDSVYSAPSAIGLRGQDFGDRVIVTRPTTSTPGYQTYGGSALSTRASFDPGSGVFTFRQDGGGLIAITGLRDTDLLQSDTQSFGLIQTPQGLLGRTNASPLSSNLIKYNPLDVNTGLVDPGQIDDRQINKPVDPALLDPRDAVPDRSITPEQRIDGLRIPETGIDTNLIDLPNDPLTVTLGTQVQSAMLLQLAGRTDNNIPNAQALAIRNQLFGPATPAQAEPGQPPQAPTNPYDKLIGDILAQARGAQIVDPADPDQEPADDNRPKWQQILESPEQAVLDAKKRSREIALRISLGMVDENGNVDFEPTLPTIDPNSDLGKLLDDLDYDLPRVTTLVGKDPNRINKLLERGEKEMAAGQFTSAESVYRQAVRETQGDPLSKAGLIHSQMGAGMIRSAAFNLRGLFSDHPELIALRYDTKLLPSKDRLRWLQGQLQEQINDQKPGADPGLILAYLGYQLEATPLIEFGLDDAQTNAPNDPLIPVLRRIWLEGEGQDKDKDATGDDAQK